MVNKYSDFIFNEMNNGKNEYGFPTRSICKILRATNWCDKKSSEKSRRLLINTRNLNPSIGIELLSSLYPDPIVRASAVQLLSELSDEDLCMFIMPLIQALKHESNIDNVLLRFLLYRSFHSPIRVGHVLFWTLIGELHTSYNNIYKILIHIYLESYPLHAEHLYDQYMLQKQLEEISRKAINQAPGIDKTKFAKNELTKLIESNNFPKNTEICLSHRLKVSNIIVDKCKIMDSKQKPLKIVFQNLDKDCRNIVTMIKIGDDVRQDQLTLQIIRIMDRVYIIIIIIIINSIGVKVKKN